MTQIVEEFRLSNSKMRAFETMCPVEFKAKYIDKIIEWETTVPMKWGSYFETLVIGGGIGGAFDIDAPENKKMKDSVFYDRVHAQAKKCKAWLKTLGGKTKSRQEYIQAEVKDASGQLILIEGTLDIVYCMMDGRIIIIDLKFTTDTDNDFGPYAWRDPSKMDMSQIIHYALLYKIKHGVDLPGTEYWVFDSKKEMKEKLVKVGSVDQNGLAIISDYSLHAHIERLSEVYNEITLAIAMDDWTPKNTYANCSKCKAKCKFERVIPEYDIVEL